MPKPDEQLVEQAQMVLDFTGTGSTPASWFKYTKTYDTRVDVSCPAHKERCPALRVGKNLAIRRPRLCALTYVHEC
jgi:hypothetical protein